VVERQEQGNNSALKGFPMADAAGKKTDVGAISFDDGIITPTTPLRLDVAARLAFPDGSMSVSALRRLVVAGKVTHEFFAGKYFVTLAAIEDMRASCRVVAKAPGSNSKPEKVAPPSGSFETESGTLALAAMNATAKRLRENLRSTSSQSTTSPKRAPVVPKKLKSVTSSPSK
jgi:hypothetical protein